MGLNSKRTLNRATHQPIQVSEDELKEMAVPRFGFLKSLNFKAEEIDEIKEKSHEADISEEFREVLFTTADRIQSEFLSNDISNLSSQLETVAELSSDTLYFLADQLLAQRSERAHSLTEAIQTLWDLHLERLDESPTEPLTLLTVEDPNQPAWETVGIEEEPQAPEIFSLQPANSLKELIARFDGDLTHTALIDQLRLNIRIFELDFDFPPAQYQQAIGLSVEELKKILEAFKVGLKVQPYGILHLERLEFTPVGTERGELVYTAPLAPEESLTFTVKESIVATKSLEEVIDSEAEVTLVDSDKLNSTLTRSLDLVQKDDRHFNVSAKVYGKYGTDHTHIGTEFNLESKMNTLNEATYKEAATHVKEMTRTATRRAKEQHTQTFRVSTVITNDKESVRAIKNPHKDRVMRVDYYSMMRKWKIDLHRYGLRVTYDITIPEPGSELMARYRKIQMIDQLLAQPFESFFDFQPWKLYSVWALASSPRMDSVNRIAEQYGTQVTPPPREMIWYKVHQTQSWSSKVVSEAGSEVVFEFPKDPRYELGSNQYGRRRYQLNQKTHAYPGLSNQTFAHESPAENVEGNLVKVLGTAKNVGNMSLTISAFLYLKREEKDAWVQKTYAHLHKAAKAQFEKREIQLKEYKKSLEAGLTETNTLKLRRLEREELMKNVLRWMFGPGFRFILPGMSAYNQNQSAKGFVLDSDTYYDELTRAVRADDDGFSIHQTVLQHGELVKFLHQAIEWENMSYFMYPYFWSNPNEWQYRRGVKHNDPVHEAFLKSGSARVVLTIRPGFEEKFLWFLKNGKLEIPKEGKSPSYITLAREMQAHANTNFPWLRSANPEDNSRPLLSYRQRKAWDEMTEIITWIEKYKSEKKVYPTKLSDIDTLAVPPKIPVGNRKDPWGSSYQYKFPGENADYDLVSFGANKALGLRTTTPANLEDEDIVSWAESSRIATWYDYTPTNALDIGQASELITPPVVPPQP